MLQVSFSTPTAMITELQRRLQQYVTGESADFGSKSTVQIDQFTDLETMVLKVYYSQKSNKQDYNLYLARKAKFMRALINHLKDIGVKWVPLERSLYDASTPATIIQQKQMQLLQQLQQPPQQPR